MTYSLATLTRTAVDSIRSYWLGPWSSRDPALANYFGGGPTLAGTRVDEHTALNLSSVWDAASIISADCASLPLITYERLADGSRRRAPNHPLYGVLHSRANRESDAFKVREALTLACLLYGNGYAEIVRDGLGRVAELWPISPWRVTPFRPDVGGRLGPLRYRIDGQTELDSTQIFHLRGLGHDPAVGLSVVSHARESLGLTMATEQFGAAFFGNGATFGGILTHPGKLTKDAKQSIRESIEDRHQGAAKGHRLVVLDNGLTFQSLGVPPEDAQFLATRLFQIQEVARWFGLPPIKLGDYSRATFSNAEQSALEYFQNCLRPRWLVRWESAIQMQLLGDGERDRYYVEHLADAILRADQKTRYESYVAGRNAGFLSVNDIRVLENLNPIRGGDRYLEPLNMSPIGASASAAAARAALVATVARFVRRESEQVKSYQATPSRFRDWLDTGRPAEQQRFAEWAQPELRACLSALGRPDDETDGAVRRLTEMYFAQSFDRLRPLADLAGLAFRQKVEQVVSEWQRDRAERVVAGFLEGL